MQNRNKEFLIIAGVPRSGKTYFAQKLAGMYRTVFVYNLGMITDFSNYEFIRVLDIDEHVNIIKDKKAKKSYLTNPSIFLFEFNNKIYHFKDAANILHGKKVKSYRISDLRSEDLFFKSCYMYLKNCLLILDDIRPVFRHGLSKGAISLFLRINHTGLNSATKNGTGLDVFAIFHNLDKVNGELYDYATKLIMFRCTRKPDLNKLSNEDIENAINKSFDDIKDLPDRFFMEIDIKSGEVIKHNPLT